VTPSFSNLHLLMLMTSPTIAPGRPARTLDENAIRQYEAAWHRGEPGAIENFLPDLGSSLYLPTLEELVLVEMEFRWKQISSAATGDESTRLLPLVESYIQRFSALDQPAIVLNLVRQEFQLRARIGETPTLEDYRRRFPKLDAQIAALALTDLTLGSFGTVTTRGIAQPAFLKSNQTFGNYEILGELGRGGMGVVYRARQLSPNRIVALKMVLDGNRAGSEELDRFRIEAEAVGRLNHPNIVQVYEAGDAGGLPFFSLEYCDGGSLAQKLNGAPQPARSAAHLIELLARAIHAAHERGIVHRDLKPANVLFSGDTPKVTDFGLAKQLDSDRGQTHTGAVMGTPSYMAPEQALGESKRVGPAVDVYALGAILYECLTGRPPFRASTVLETLDQVRNRDPVGVRELNPDVPRNLETICLKCLNKEPAKRYASAAELAEDLRRFQAGESILARPATKAEKIWRWCRRNPPLAITAALAVLALVGAVLATLGYALEQKDNANQQERAANRLRDANFKISRFTNLSARMAAERGQGLGEKDDVAACLLWYARALEMTPDDNPKLEWFIRTNLSAWQRHFHPLQAIFPHEHKVTAVAFSPDGQTMLIGDAGGVAQLWDVGTGRPFGKKMVHEQPVVYAAFAADGAAVATQSTERYSTNGSVRVWDARNGEPVGPSLEHAFAIAYPSLSPDGRRVLTSSFRAGMVQCWNVETGATLARLGKDAGEPIVAAFHPDGQSFVTGAKDGKIRRYRTENAALLKETQLHRSENTPLKETQPAKKETQLAESQIRSVVYSLDGKLLVAGSHAGTVHVLNAQSHEAVSQPLQNEAPAFQVGISADNQTVFAAGFKTVRFWDLRTANSTPAEATHDSVVLGAAFSSDGSTLATYCSDGTAHLWDVAGGRRIGSIVSHRVQMTDARLGPNGRYLLTAGEDSAARLWNVAGIERDRLASIPSAEYVDAIAFSKDGKMFLTAGVSGVQRWNAEARERVGSHLRHEKGVSVRSIAFGPGDETILAGCGNGDMRLWNSHSGQPIQTIPSPFQHKERVFSISFCPDGSRFATHCLDRTARIWKWDSPGAPERVLDPELVAAVGLSQDGSKLATGRIDETIHFWNTSTGEEVGRPLEQAGAITGISFGPDSDTLLTTTFSRAYLWHLASGECIALSHEDGGLMVRDFSPDGKLAITAGTDANLRIWDADTGKPIGPVLRHGGGIFAGAFSPDGRIILTGGKEQKTRIWATPTPVEGDKKQIVRWIEVLTGAELDDSGKIHTLDAASWEARREELQNLGGAPVHRQAGSDEALSADFSDPTGKWVGWFKNNKVMVDTIMPEAKSTIEIRWTGLSGSGKWDSYEIENMIRVKNGNGANSNRFDWRHRRGDLHYQVSIVPYRMKDGKVSTLLAAYVVTSSAGKYLYQGEGYFDRQDGR
jgi:WD40 repeat protein/serine/threonine protein kinase